MKNILCYGDSNTWGFDPETRERFPADIRWTGILREILNNGYNVIEEGLNGRTTVWDDPFMESRNGKKHLIPCLETHCPLDLVIIMLGTNDLKSIYSLSAYNIAAGAEVLARIVKNSNAGSGGKAPKVLLISPALIGENIGETWLAEMFGLNSIQTSKEFSKYYKTVADNLACEILDAAQIVEPSPIDAIHIDAGEHRKLGSAIAVKVREILG